MSLYISLFCCWLIAVTSFYWPAQSAEAAAEGRLSRTPRSKRAACLAGRVRRILCARECGLPHIFPLRFFAILHSFRRSAPRRFRGKPPSTNHRHRCDAWAGPRRHDSCSRPFWRHGLHRYSSGTTRGNRVRAPLRPVRGADADREHLGDLARLGGRSTESMRWYGLPHRMPCVCEDDYRLTNIPGRLPLAAGGAGYIQK
jgi:hypothetical protein